MITCLPPFFLLQLFFFNSDAQDTCDVVLLNTIGRTCDLVQFLQRITLRQRLAWLHWRCVFYAHLVEGRTLARAICSDDLQGLFSKSHSCLISHTNCQAGGNAADAAAAIQFALNVVQPFSTGIGGGFLALIYNATTVCFHLSFLSIVPKTSTSF